MDTCHILNLGTVDFLQAWELQKSLVQQVAEKRRPNTLLLLQHPHTYTIGRRGSRQDILMDSNELDCLGIAVHEVDRGGEATYHGPGQLVAYPIVNLRTWGGPLKYVRALEQVMIKTLADYDIDAHLIQGLTGVWVGREKIGAIGVKISRGVTCHGLSLNVDPNLDFYRHIIPCGNPTDGITSMKKLLGESLSLNTVAYSLQYHFGRQLKFRMVESEPEPGLLEGIAEAPTLHPR